MLAATAFLATGLIIALFAHTIHRLKVMQNQNPSYRTAYFLLAIAFIAFGITSAVANQSLLEISVLFSNFCIFLASGLLLAKGKPKNSWVALSTGVALVLVTVRYVWFFPEPVLRDGILYFNTQPVAGALIALVFLAIWLPANVRIAKSIALSIKFEEAFVIYAGLFALATASAIFFLASRSAASVIVTFAIMAASFLSLLCINVLAQKMEG